MATITGANCSVQKIRGMSRPTCIRLFGIMDGTLGIPKGRVFSDSELANWQATVIAGLTADNEAERFYWIYKFHTVTTQYQDAQTVTRGDNTTRTVQDAVAGWQAQYDNGGFCFSQAVASMDQSQDRFDYIFHNTKGTWIGTEKLDGTTYKFGGISLSQFNSDTPMVFATGETDNYMLTIMLAEDAEVFDRGWFVDTSWNASALPGVQDVFLAAISTINGSGVVNVTATLGCGSSNIATNSLSTFFANTGRWVATNAVTGSAITISTVTANANGYLVFDFDHTDADYPASGGTILLRTANISTLAGAFSGTTTEKYFESYAKNPATGLAGRELRIAIP